MACWNSSRYIECSPLSVRPCIRGDRNQVFPGGIYERRGSSITKRCVLAALGSFHGRGWLWLKELGWTLKSLEWERWTDSFYLWHCKVKQVTWSNNGLLVFCMRLQGHKRMSAIDLIVPFLDRSPPAPRQAFCCLGVIDCQLFTMNRPFLWITS